MIRKFAITTITAATLMIGTHPAQAESLKPMQALSIAALGQEIPVVVYYIEVSKGYEVVTTWLDQQGTSQRQISFLAPGQRYALNLAEQGVPIRLDFAAGYQTADVQVEHTVVLTADRFTTPGERYLLGLVDAGWMPAGLTETVFSPDVNIVAR